MSILKNAGVQLFIAIIILATFLVFVIPNLNLGANTAQISEALINAAIVLIPVFVAWFTRTYVKTKEDEKNIALVANLAERTIGYVEDLHKNKQLDPLLEQFNISDKIINEGSSGLKRLNAATKVLVSELETHKISMSDEEAEKIIRGEFQKMTGDLNLNRGVFERTDEAINLLQALQKAGLINLPAEVLQATQLADHIAQWAAQPQDKPKPVQEVAFLRAMEALVSTQKDPLVEDNGQEVLQPKPIDGGEISQLDPIEAKLKKMAASAYDQAKKLATVGNNEAITEKEIATALLIAALANREFTINREQIAQAIHNTFEGWSSSEKVDS